MFLLRWLREVLLSRRPEEDRPGDDDQFAVWPHDLDRFNEPSRLDAEDRR